MLSVRCRAEGRWCMPTDAVSCHRHGCMEGAGITPRLVGSTHGTVQWAAYMCSSSDATRQQNCF
jgi:hypothetical protein